jgi:ankyrin repeat protein
MEILQFLLKNGADVNALGGEYGTALQAAAFHHKQYVDMLLDLGADPRIEGGKYGSALKAAKEKGWNRVVKLLSQRVGI